MAALQYVKAEPISLRDHPDFNEAWLQTRISDDPSIIGLGDVEVLERERRQDRAGRLDLLLFDRRANTRYEVELMLGPSDESHIIRCLEYWDIERRRYPAYDHCAVLVAESITGRFINVLSLFAGTVPLIAIQLAAVRVGDQIVLNFVRVLDRVGLRNDDELDAPETGSNRENWNAQATPATVALVDKFLEIINKAAKSPFQLNYLKHYIGLSDGNRSRNFAYFIPKKKYTYVYAKVPDASGTSQKLGGAGFEAGVDKYNGYAWMMLRPDEIQAAMGLLTEVLQSAVAHQENG